MIYSIFPSRDATLYQNSESVNTGIDEILEITKTVSSSGQSGVSSTRILMDFNTTAISQSWSVNEISGSDGQDPKYFLKVYNISENQIANNYILAIAPVSESWIAGLGKSTYTPLTNEGVSWKYRDGYTPSTQWSESGGTVVTESGYTVTQTFDGSSSDIDVDITGIITSSFPGKPLAYQNNGVLIQLSGSQEIDGVRYGSLKYFSKETHTIYSPRLEVKWDDSQFVSGSLTALTGDNITVGTSNLQSEYKEQARTRIRLLARELYPIKTYTTSSETASPNFIPSSSYYSIVDASTNETIIPFDTSYTKISLDNSGNYFNLWMDSLLPERFYKIGVRVDHRQYTNQQEYFTCDTLFKVVR
jgi:hypothetical protein